MALAWNTENASEYLKSLIGQIPKLNAERRDSAQWTKWSMMTLAFLEEVFGRKSRPYLSFAELPWGMTGKFVIDMDEFQRDSLGRVREGTNEFIDRKHQEA